MRNDYTKGARGEHTRELGPLTQLLFSQDLILVRRKLCTLVWTDLWIADHNAELQTFVVFELLSPNRYPIRVENSYLWSRYISHSAE